MDKLVLCGEGMAQFYESIGMKVERPTKSDILNNISGVMSQVFQPVQSETKWMIMIEKTFKQFKVIIERRIK